MATVLFSVAGAAVGGAVGGSVAGLTSAVVGRAIGATLGRSIDQRLLGQGGQAIETGKVDRFRITSAGEGDPIARVYGRMRMGGHVIWASDFQESRTTTGGGKGGGSTPETTEFSYSVSLAIAICEGEIVRVARVWADGEEVAPDDLNMTFYPGSADQPPDPTMEAIEGVGRVPAYRGTAYVVMENLELAQFGNRVPQFSFEVLRPEQPGAPGWEHTPTYGIEGVALIPGTGEYALATTPATFAVSNGVFHNANVSSPAGKTDFAAATEAITQELPNLKSASLVVSWFGDDLRCGDCTIRPKVEDLERDAKGLPWTGSGMPREFAQVIVQEDERPLYGGTPSDASVVQAIRELNEADVAVMFYPFILMDQYTDNGLPDPYSAEPNQPNLPWRGRITLAEAPGRPGSPDGTSVANSQVNAFFGSATASSFTIFEGQVRYNPDWGNPNGAEPSGFEDVPANWSFSRFILHNAWLCAVAGGVDAFCIGSEMRGLTQIRGAGGAFVAVQRLRALAAEVRSILGPDTKISYAADWSEYFGYHPEDGSGDHYFHLDPLWADENIDFIGIDNYMPLADWRDEDGHLDGQTWDSVYNLDYLKANAAGGEGFDWYYASDADRDAQNRTPITDGLFGEDWVYRYKDIRSWWENPHHDRVGPNRIAEPTAWVPRSKPIWFTEYGCAAVNKGANQPNKFLDFKSSESSLPYHSTGARDELMQAQYLQATIAYWSDPAHNPTSAAYGAPMVDMSRAFVWAYDTRPYPFFPNNLEKWSDGENYNRGHWINGRTAGRTLASVVHEICEDAGLKDFSTDGLYGYVRGYAVEQVGDARAALQPLMIQHGFDAVERDGILQFRNRAAQRPQALDPALFAESRELDGRLEQTREAEAEVSGRMRLRFVQADADYDVIAEEATLPDEATHGVSGSEINVCLTRGEGRQTVERWLTEARVARDTVRFALPPSQLCIGAGDVIELPGDQSERAATYRIDRVEISDMQLVEGVRVDQGVYETGVIQESTPPSRPFVAPVPVLSHFLDLPLLRGDETAHAPHVAATAEPWPGSAAIYQSSADQNYALNSVVTQRSIIGMTKSPLTPARAGVFDRGAAVTVELVQGALSSVDEAAVLSGANVAAIGDGSADNWEVFQFAQAELTPEPNVYILRTLLRGQGGTDGATTGHWPAGAQFVLLDGKPSQIELSPSLRGVTQHYRIGPSTRGYDDASFTHVEQAFEGNGLRPLSPVHLSAAPDGAGGHAIRWVRRTRIDGDRWESPQVPLGEESESYIVEIMQGGTLRRSEIVQTPGWGYTAAMKASDAVTGSFEVSVAQVSASFGPGPAGQITVEAS